jgi:hypothetical protein
MPEKTLARTEGTGAAVDLDEILAMTERLPLVDKVRLIERLAPRIAQEVQSAASPSPRKSLRGLWKGLDVSDEDIAHARREMWGNFPLGDL